MATITKSLLSLLLILSVTASGVQAKDLATLSRATAPAAKKSGREDSQSIKIHHDAHTHVDKQVLKTALQTSGKYQTDGRSLRLMQHKHSTFSAEMSLRMQGFLKQYLSVSYA